MISGIRSLSQAHEQLIVGWTGDVQSPSGVDKIPFDTISQQERIDFESALKEYEPRAPDADDEKDQMTKYIPVWLDDKVAHGHYDGYCKQSPYFQPLPLSKLSLTHLHDSPMAVIPLPLVARRRYRICFCRLSLPVL